MKTIEYNVKGMHCISCSTGIAKLVKRLDNVDKVEVELGKSKIHVTFNTDAIDHQEIINAVDRLGYKAEPAE